MIFDVPKKAAAGAPPSLVVTEVRTATLADVIHPFPAFNRVLGATVEELAAKTAMQHVA